MNKETALITGTTSGIGYQICRELAKRKINLFLVSRNTEQLKKQASNLKKEFGISVFYLALDLTNSDATKTISEELLRNKIQIDYLINNAGFNEVGYFLKTSLEKELEMIHLHITFITELTKYVLPIMMKNKNGYILNIASTGSYIPCPYDTVYTATKAYLLSFSKGLAAECNGTGVSVTAVCPGATKTSFASKAGIDKSLLFKILVSEADHVASKSIKAMMKGKRVKIIGTYNKLLILSNFLLPTKFINYMSKKMIYEN